MGSPPESEEALAARAQAGDQDAFGRLLELVRPELEVFVRVHWRERFRTRESVHDVVQSVCRECVADVSAFAARGAGSFRAWLRGIALHKLVSRQRYHLAAARDPARERDVDTGALPDDGEPIEPFAASLQRLPSPSQHAISREEAERLHRALALLPEDQRQVVTMAKLLGMPHAEIGAVLGKPEATCRVLLKRGLVQLTARLVQFDDER